MVSERRGRMPEPKLVNEFPECWNCQETATVSKVAYDQMVEEGRLKPGLAPSTRRQIIPLIDPQKAVLTMPILIVQWDICANCGVERCVRAEAVEAPITMQEIKGRGGRGPHHHAGDQG